MPTLKSPPLDAIMLCTNCIALMITLSTCVGVTTQVCTLAGLLPGDNSACVPGLAHVPLLVAINAWFAVMHLVMRSWIPSFHDMCCCVIVCCAVFLCTWEMEAVKRCAGDDPALILHRSWHTTLALLDLALIPLVLGLRVTLAVAGHMVYERAFERIRERLRRRAEGVEQDPEEAEIGRRWAPYFSSEEGVVWLRSLELKHQKKAENEGEEENGGNNKKDL